MCVHAVQDIEGEGGRRHQNRCTIACVCMCVCVCVYACVLCVCVCILTCIHVLCCCIYCLHHLQFIVYRLRTHVLDLIQISQKEELEVPASGLSVLN